MASGCYESPDRVTGGAASYVMAVGGDSLRAASGVGAASLAAREASFDEKLLQVDDELKLSSSGLGTEFDARLDYLTVTVDRLGRENAELRRDLERLRQVLQQSGFSV